MRLQGKTIMKGYKRQNNERTAAVDEKKWKEKAKGRSMKEQLRKTCRKEHVEGKRAGKSKREKI
jgi:hypothetical protein